MIAIADQTELHIIAQELFNTFVQRYNFLGGLLVGLSGDSLEYETILASGFPLAPFCGVDKSSVGDVINDCKLRHDAPHLHNAGNLSLPVLAKRHGSWPESTKRIWYQPFECLDKNLIFLGFVKLGEFNLKPSDTLNSLQRISKILIYERDLTHVKATLKATENFVREIGHDFAGNVQAILAKINVLRRPGLTQGAIVKKLNEIETEIRAAYSQAEQLGITVDSNYDKRNETYFNLIDVTEEAINQLEAEAKERKIAFRVPMSSSSAGARNRTNIFGDRGAIEICVVQIILNSIKYAFGSTSINCEFDGDAEFVHLDITNIGHPLPTGQDANRIWELGFRGENAKAMHVNGSGVGLYTVRKITVAHYGVCIAIHDPTSKLTKVSLKLPRKNIVKHKLGVIQ